MEGLKGTLTSIAICWRIERRDGMALGLTSHDRDLAVDGFVYRAAPGMVPSAIELDGSGGGMDVSGALTSEGISERDLLAGRWDGAAVEVLAVDWRGGGETLSLAGGAIGAVEMEGEGFGAELSGRLAMLERPVSERTSPDCRAELGDRRCRVAMAGRRRFARVTAADGRLLTLDAAEPVADAYGEGRVRWVSGANSGLEDAVLSSRGATLTLRRAPRFASVGAMLLVEQGCDKRIETCRSRFGNAVNFQGEPYLPGIDLLTRYPGG